MVLLYRPGSDATWVENESEDMHSQGTPVTPGRGILRGQGNAGQHSGDMHVQGDRPAAPKKSLKKVRYVKDDVIELDENVMKVLVISGTSTQRLMPSGQQAARDKYLEEQNKLRAAEILKRNEKEAARRVDEMIWAPPPHCKCILLGLVVMFSIFSILSLCSRVARVLARRFQGSSRCTHHWLYNRRRR